METTNARLQMREGSAFQDGGNLQYAFNVRLQSTSYSWWDDGRVDSRIAGKDIGINVDNSGTFADLANRGNGVRQAQFGGNYWYDRGGSAGYAINAQDALVMATADTIASSLPEGRTDNGTPLLKQPSITFTLTFPTTVMHLRPQTPACLAAGTGIRRTNQRLLQHPANPWSAGVVRFGVLGDPFYSNEGWEAHEYGAIFSCPKDSCGAKHCAPNVLHRRTGRC